MKRTNKTKVFQTITMFVYAFLILMLSALVFADGDGFDTGEGGGYNPRWIWWRG